jgi:ribose 1,5-bisphosphokinase
MGRSTGPPAMRGRLVAVMGPSGAGKDALIGYVRPRVDPACIIFGHRYITRPADAGGENHVSLSPAEFAARRAAGLFALTWESHGLGYGIGGEVELWLGRGLVVVVNIARAAWSDAAARYPGLTGVLVTAAPEILAHRLAARGREGQAAILERLARDVPLPDHPALHRLDNSGDLAVAGEAFLRFVTGSG